MKKQDIINRLYELRDEKYRDFQAKLIPSVDPETIIGVRTPDLRRLAKLIDAHLIFEGLPHKYFEENQLHAFALSLIKDFDECVHKTDEFLPFVDNWATCDQLSPKVFKKHRAELLPFIDRWIDSGETYTVRFGIGMLMEHFLDEDFDPRYAERVAAVKSDEYYVNMMAAWYFATALAKRYDSVLPFIEERRLYPDVHKKAVQKALESYRIPPDRKEKLRTLR